MSTGDTDGRYVGHGVLGAAHRGDQKGSRDSQEHQSGNRAEADLRAAGRAAGSRPLPSCLESLLPPPGCQGDNGSTWKRPC